MCTWNWIGMLIRVKSSKFILSFWLSTGGQKFALKFSLILFCILTFKLDQERIKIYQPVSKSSATLLKTLPKRNPKSDWIDLRWARRYLDSEERRLFFSHHLRRSWSSESIWNFLVAITKIVDAMGKPPNQRFFLRWISNINITDVLHIMCWIFYVDI